MHTEAASDSREGWTPLAGRVLHRRGVVHGTLLTRGVDSADETRVVPGTPLTNLIDWF
jgi:hypothetical protein